jgi:hypothetical protein
VETKVLEENGSNFEIKVPKDNHSKMETESVSKESRSKVQPESKSPDNFTKETQSAQGHCRDVTTETYYLDPTVPWD